MASSSTSSSKNGWVGKVLQPAFYERDTRQVARDLLGKVLVVSSRGRECAMRITETEAYGGDDPASHSSRGMTARTRVMFGPPGRAYVYFIYGMYEMLNFVTEKEGVAGAVLIRAGEPLSGLEAMARRRKLKAGARPADLTNGPGRLCNALGIRMSHNGKALQGPELEVLDAGFTVPADAILCSPRVGISAATDRYWRYHIRGNASVSKAPQNALARVWEPALDDVAAPEPRSLAPRRRKAGR